MARHEGHGVIRPTSQSTHLASTYHPPTQDPYCRKFEPACPKYSRTVYLRLGQQRARAMYLPMPANSKQRLT